MGKISFGAPRDVVDQIQANFKLSTFVETGTYMGGTAAWASERFQQVYTIEGSPDFHRQAQERQAGRSNIEFLLGDSRAMLGEVVAKLGNTPALFWLDAHWMPGSFGETHECPVIEEIATIYRSPAQHFILIDDARLFLLPPPLPHRAVDWPDIAAVLKALDAATPGSPYTVVHNDAIISVPATARAVMEKFYQEQATADDQERQRDLNPDRRRRIVRRVERLLGL